MVVRCSWYPAHRFLRWSLSSGFQCWALLNLIAGKDDKRDRNEIVYSIRGTARISHLYGLVNFLYELKLNTNCAVVLVKLLMGNEALNWFGEDFMRVPDDCHAAYRTSPLQA